MRNIISMQDRKSHHVKYAVYPREKRIKYSNIEHTKTQLGKDLAGAGRATKNKQRIKISRFSMDMASLGIITARPS